MTNQETLQATYKGLCERLPGVVRARAGEAWWNHIYDALKENEYEVERTSDGGVQPWQGDETVEHWRVCMRWSTRGVERPNLLVAGKPVELDATLAPEAVVYDSRESM